MRLHHLNCITMCPPGGRLMDGRSRGLGESALVCHCVLIESDRGLLLLDTGFGLNDVLGPRPRLSPFFLGLCRPRLVESQTAVRQIERLGFAAGDVKHIILTHLDFDHAGGLDDFPEAKIHLLATERDAAFAQRTRLDRMRFRPGQWARSQGRWVTYPVRGEDWYGFECVRELEGLPPELLLVPLPGHTLGHAGIAVKQEQGWLLHAGDAYFYREEMNPARPRCTPGLRLYQFMMEKDRRLRLQNQERLRELVRRHGDDVTVFCAHDANEFERMEALEKAPGHALFPSMPEAEPPRVQT